MAVGCLLGCPMAITEAATIDLTTGLDATGMINGAIFQVDNTQPAGTGIFGRDETASGGVFLRTHMNGVEEGYNTSATGVMDNVGGPFTRDLLYSSLNKVTIDGVGYVPFLLDLNEISNPNGRSITLESLQLFKADSGGLAFETIGELSGASSTTLLYDLDGIPDGDSRVFMDYGLVNRGSGAADVGVFIPMSNFEAAGVGLDDHIILYSHFTGADAGFEEWTVGAGIPDEDDPGSGVLPEPSTGMLGALGLMMILRRRSRS